MKVVDTFIFSGELDILEIRLRYMSSMIDKFVIVESDKTFQGNDKPHHLADNWGRYKEWHDKIEYYAITQDPSVFEFRQVYHYDASNGPFRMEEQCRLALTYANDLIEDTDVVLLSDVDELPSHDFIKDVREVVSVSPYVSQQDFYAFYLNNKTVEGPDVSWAGTIACSGKTWKTTTPQALRDRRNHLPKVYGSGWHLSWMGGLDAVKNKIRSFAHVEFNREDIVNDEAILSAIESGRDVLQRPGVSYQIQSMNVFPEDLRAILLDYPHLIK